MVKVIDGRGNATLLDYADCFGAPEGNARINSAPAELSSAGSFALVTKITRPENLITYSQFDYYLGLPVDGEDENGIVTSGSYNDALDRPTQVRRAAGTSLSNQTTFSYDDTNRVVTTSSDLNANNDNLLTGKTLYDGLGRTTETRQYEGGTNYIVVQTQYDSLGRAFKTSNPFRPWQSEVAIWTTTWFDALGRVVSVATPDSAVVTTSYSGNTVTVTDQTGKKRKVVTDALGRLIEVYEDPTGLNYLTSYSYDALDNLTTVNQGTQTRTFVYDSLKRLTSATNPESGTINYTYDNNSNLLTKTDARPVTSTYTYDALNRNTSVDYLDTSITPDITRFYDGAVNGKGRFWYDYSGGNYATGADVEATSIDSYDALGRPLQRRQIPKVNGTWGQTFAMSRSYNFAGGVTSQTYPSIHTVNYTYDNAGRTSSFAGNLGDGTQRNYATGISYSAFGGLSQEQFGTTPPLYNKLFYNVRGQLAEIRASTTPNDTSWNRGSIINHYSNQCWGMCGGPNSTQSMSDNNGNLKRQQVDIPDIEQVSSYVSYTSWFAYDSLNRLQSTNGERWASGPNIIGDYWKQSFVYDCYGNRSIDTNAANTYGGGVNNLGFEVEPGTNRLYSPGDLALLDASRRIRYDQAGNQKKDTYTGAGDRTYDAENRLKTAWGGNNQWQYYTYNANGQRTRRKINGVETWQVYGFDGELLAEYAANISSPVLQKEYGYRNGQLLVTGNALSTVQSTEAVSWTGATNVTVTGNSLAKSVATSAWDAGANSAQEIVAGDGYVEFTASETTTSRMAGLSHGNTDVGFSDIDFALYAAAGSFCVYEAGTSRGCFGSYSTGDTLRVAVEAGAVKYKRNGTVLYTSSVSPTYPLLVDTSFWDSGATINSVVVSGLLSVSGGSSINWLVSDQLGTPRMTVGAATIARTSWEKALVVSFGLKDISAVTAGIEAITGIWFAKTVKESFSNKKAVAEALNECRKLL